MALVEHAHQVDDLRSRLTDLPDLRWWALGPGAMDRLETLGCSYRIPEDVADLSEIGAACHAGRKQLAALIQLLDDELLRHEPALRSVEIFPFQFHRWALTILWDGIWSRIRMLRAIVEHEQPGRIFFHTGRAYPSDPLLRFDNRETLWGRLAEPVARPRCASVTVFPDPPEALDATRSLRGTITARLRWSALGRAMVEGLDACIRLSALSRAARQRDFTALTDMLLPGGRSGLLVIGDEEWNDVIPRLRDRGWRIIRTSDWLMGGTVDLPGEPTLPTPVEGILNSQGRRDLLECDGTDFGGLVLSRLDWIWSAFPGRCIAGHRRLQPAYRRLRLRALLRSQSPTGLAHGLDQSVRVSGIPVLTWQHGFVAHGQDIVELQDYNDLLTSDVTLAYGPGAADAYKNHSRLEGAWVESVGSARIAAWRERQEKPRPRQHPLRVLYATNKYNQNSWYLRSDLPWSDRLFYRDQRAIAEGLARLAETAPRLVEIVVKLHPGRTFSRPPWVEHLIDGRHVRVVHDGATFKDLLQEADAVVLDTPTTSNLEAAATALPLFVLTRHWGLSADVWNRLGKRAVLKASADDLVEAVERWAASGEYDADAGDEEFVRAFGAPFDLEATRAAAVSIVEAAAGEGRKGPATPSRA